MQPTFFGERAARLFGAYHAPARATASAPSVVLCHPIAHEYFRMYRAVRLMAERLSRAGAHVWTFDYSGTGDSAGGSEDGDLEAWVAEVRLAVQELRTRSLAAAVALVGFRFGGSLAAMAAAENPLVDRLVLCDPVPDGARYLSELLELAVGPDGSPLPTPGHDVVTVVGVPFTARLRDQIAAVRLPPLLDRFTGRVAVVSTAGAEGGGTSTEWTGTRRIDVLETVPAELDWRARSQEPIVPQPVIQWITTHLTGDR